MESLRAVVQGEFDTSPRLSLRWMTLADAPNPVAHIRTWGRSGGRRRSCCRFATARHGTGDTGRHRTTKPRAGARTGRHVTSEDDTGRQTVYQICTQGVAVSNPAVSTNGEAPLGALILLSLSL